MELSFIVVTYKRDEALHHCLESIRLQQNLPQPYEIVLVDNGGSSRVAPAWDDMRFHLDRPPQNLGVAGGRNRGMLLAQGQKLIFIDDDARWHDAQCVSRLLATLDSRPDCAAVGVKVIDPTDETIIENLLPHPNKPYLLSVTEPVETPYFYGGAHVIRREALQKVGDYPERFFYGMEEIDLCLRLFNQNYTVLYDPQVAIYHHRSTSVGGQAYWIHQAVNKSRVTWRNLPLPYPLTVMAIWSAAAIWKTRRLDTGLRIARQLWSERELLRQERRPLSLAALQHLRRIGARLTY